jgi:hypothetical protein
MRNWETFALNISGNAAPQYCVTECGGNNLPGTGWVERGTIHHRGQMPHVATTFQVQGGLKAEAWQYSHRYLARW